MSKNPFKKGTKQNKDFETMSDLKWHCTKCELKAGQAKTFQQWRQKNGIQLEEPTPRRWEKRIICEKCKQKTVHRKLKSLVILEDTCKRAGITQKLGKKIKKIYEYEEAVFLRKLPSRELEIDHKFPQIRWGKDEEKTKDLTEKEIKKKFILLTRSNNLLKSRYCEKCVKTNKRGYFPGIKFWYKGNENWEGETKFDESGCKGCFWYNPYKWREELKKIINKNS